MFRRHLLWCALIPLMLAACDRPADPNEPTAEDRAAAAAAAPAATPPAAVAAPPPEAAMPPARVEGPVAARAAMMPTAGNAANGELLLVPENGGLRLTGRLSGLTAGAEHGFHVHEKGDCSAPDASSAGDHFNPSGAPHGDPGAEPHHAGDMPNLMVDAQGNAEVNLMLPGLTLADGGANDVLGRAIVLHAARDDYSTQPSGNAGARIGCGLILRSALPASADATGAATTPPTP